MKFESFICAADAATRKTYALNCSQILELIFAMVALLAAPVEKESEQL